MARYNVTVRFGVLGRSSWRWNPDTDRRSGRVCFSIVCAAEHARGAAAGTLMPGSTRTELSRPECSRPPFPHRRSCSSTWRSRPRRRSSFPRAAPRPRPTSTPALRATRRARSAAAASSPRRRCAHCPTRLYLAWPDACACPFPVRSTRSTTVRCL